MQCINGILFACGVPGNDRGGNENLFKRYLDVKHLHNKPAQKFDENKYIFKMKNEQETGRAFDEKKGF